MSVFNYAKFKIMQSSKSELPIAVLTTHGNTNPYNFKVSSTQKHCEFSLNVVLLVCVSRQGTN